MDAERPVKRKIYYVLQIMSKNLVNNRACQVQKSKILKSKL